jgi:hypothetical protein
MLDRSTRSKVGTDQKWFSHHMARYPLRVFFLLGFPFLLSEKSQTTRHMQDSIHGSTTLAVAISDSRQTHHGKWGWIDEREKTGSGYRDDEGLQEPCKNDKNIEFSIWRNRGISLG